MIEVKNARRSHTLSGEYLQKLWREALSQGKEARLIVRFEDVELEAIITLRRLTVWEK